VIPAVRHRVAAGSIAGLFPAGSDAPGEVDKFFSKNPFHGFYRISAMTGVLFWSHGARPVSGRQFLLPVDDFQ